MDTDILDLHESLERARQHHGGLCAGIAMGTRMAIGGLAAIGIDDPLGKDRRNFVVFVESDRCATDAILAVTGCSPGRRSMKVLDYGKMAATFVNLQTGKAFRVAAKDRGGPSDRDNPDPVQEESDVERYIRMNSEDLFDIREVTVDLRPQDMPGKTLRVVACSVCGERIMDMREVRRDGATLCRPCAEGRTYWLPAEDRKARL